MNLRNKIPYFLKHALGDGELPVAYKRLQNIIFDGDMYYDTNKKLTGSDVITMSIYTATSSGQNLFGAYSGTGAGNINLSIYVYATNSSQSYFRYGTTLLRPTLGTGRKTITFGGGGSTDGFLRDVTYDSDEFETTDVAWIGGLPNSSSPKFTGKIYGDIVVGNRLKYIPCERVSDGAIGYYEVFTKTFLESEGTGTPTTDGYAI